MLANPFNQPLTFIACWFWWSIKRSSTCTHLVTLIDQRGSVNKDFSCQLNLRQCCSHIQKWAGLVDATDYVAQLAWWVFLDIYMVQYVTYIYVLAVRPACSLWRQPVRQVINHQALNLEILLIAAGVRKPQAPYTSFWPVDWWALTHRLGSQTWERDLRCQRHMGPLFQNIVLEVELDLSHHVRSCQSSSVWSSSVTRLRNVRSPWWMLLRGSIGFAPLDPRLHRLHLHFISCLCFGSWNTLKNRSHSVAREFAHWETICKNPISFCSNGRCPSEGNMS